MKNGWSLRALFAQEFPFFMSAPALLWQILFLYVPLALIVVASFIPMVNGTWDYSSFTLEHYRDFFDFMYVRIIARSCLLAFTTVTVCLLLAYPMAYFIAFYARRWKNLLLFLLILPFWLSLLVQVYAWFMLLDTYGLLNRFLLFVGIISEPIQMLNTSFAIYIIMVYCYLPFMILPIYSTLEKLDTRLFDASMDLGASPFKTFMRITLPLSLSGIRTGALLVLVPAFGEFVVPALAGGGKHMFVGTLISHYFLIAQNPALGTAFTCISAVVLLILAVGLHFGLGLLVGSDDEGDE